MVDISTTLGLPHSGAVQTLEKILTLAGPHHASKFFSAMNQAQIRVASLRGVSPTKCRTWFLEQVRAELMVRLQNLDENIQQFDPEADQNFQFSVHVGKLWWRTRVLDGTGRPA